MSEKPAPPTLEVRYENVRMPLFNASNGDPIVYHAASSFLIGRSANYFERFRFDPQFSELTGRKIEGEFKVLRHITGGSIIVSVDEAKELIAKNPDWREDNESINVYKKN